MRAPAVRRNSPRRGGGSVDRSHRSRRQVQSNPEGWRNAGSAAPAGADLRSAGKPVAASLEFLATGYVPASLRDGAGIDIRRRRRRQGLRGRFR
ncbi:MAG: hypothetical protein R3F11_32350 [Verrucomicrobiales bacterium]